MQVVVCLWYKCRWGISVCVLWLEERQGKIYSTFRFQGFVSRRWHSSPRKCGTQNIRLLGKFAPTQSRSRILNPINRIYIQCRIVLLDFGCKLSSDVEFVPIEFWNLALCARLVFKAELCDYPVPKNKFLCHTFVLGPANWTNLAFMSHLMIDVQYSSICRISTRRYQGTWARTQLDM